jgi:histidinol dehydrogenase
MRIALEKTIGDLTPLERLSLMDRRPSEGSGLREQVRRILREVEEEGDRALFRMAAEFDGVDLESLEVPRSQWEDALLELSPTLRAALEEAAENIRRFHQAQIPEPVQVEVRPGVTIGRTAVPLDRVGVYAPGGRAAYPSSVLMGVVPASAVGVREVVVCSPPGPGGAPSKEVMAACALGGATRLFAVGGAGAIGAMAFGTSSIPRVDAVVGPGNRYVTEAKRQIAGDLLIDAPAGPSEVLVVAEAGADPHLCALELVCQAEHDPDAAVALVSTSSELLRAVRARLEEEVARAPRREIVLAALSTRGALLRASTREEALAFAREYAPEHLALFTRSPGADLEMVPTAGTAFLGQSAAVAFGDYLTGANHVLPTGGMARSFSGLSTLNYVRTYTWQEITAEAAEAMSEAVEILAEAEGLPGHAESVRARRGARP